MIIKATRPQIIFNSILVFKVGYQKHLGLILDSTLSLDMYDNDY